MALELAKHNPVYEDIASKFFEVCSSFTSYLALLHDHCSILSSSRTP